MIAKKYLNYTYLLFAILYSLFVYMIIHAVFIIRGKVCTNTLYDDTFFMTLRSAFYVVALMLPLVTILRFFKDMSKSNLTKLIMSIIPIITALFYIIYACM
jgi:uncharacterized membrane protein YhaH (DUF805 family)